MTTALVGILFWTVIIYAEYLKRNAEKNRGQAIEDSIEFCQEGDQ